MAKKKTVKATGAKIDVPEAFKKASEEQVKQASEMIAGVPGKEVPPPKAKAVPAKSKKGEKSKTSTPKLPDFIKDDVTSYVVGTEDYRKLVEDFNKRNATAYNPWRVRPQILYVIWKEQKEYYGAK